MPSLLGPINQTPYIGGQTPSLLAVDAAGLQTTWKVNLSAIAAPTVMDDSNAGYAVGSRWYYGASIYECTSATVGAAVWTSSDPAGTAAAAVSAHASLTTGIHGLAITAGQTLTVTTGGTLGSAAYTASTDYAAAAHVHSGTYVAISGDTMTGGLTITTTSTQLTLKHSTGLQTTLRTGDDGYLTIVPSGGVVNVTGGLWATYTTATAISGTSTEGYGVYGISRDSTGLYGESTLSGTGVYGTSGRGRAGHFGRNNVAGTAATAVVEIVQDSAISDTNPALRVQQDGTGDILQLYDGATKAVWVADGGQLNVLGTASQQKWLYDSLNYVTTTVSSVGAMTFASVSATSVGAFSFSNPVTITSTTEPQFTLTNGTGTATMSVSATGVCTFNAAGAGAGFSYSDNVGIGMAPAAYKLSVYGAGGFGTEAGGCVVQRYFANIGEVLGADVTGNVFNPLQFRTGSSPSVYLDTSGNVDVGTTTSSGKLTVESTTTQAAFRYDANNYATWTVGATGLMTLSGASTAGTTHGIKIGDSTSYLLSFWNATPIVQPTTAFTEATFTENAGGTTVNENSTFGGYTLQQIVAALRAVGLLA